MLFSTVLTPRLVFLRDQTHSHIIKCHRNRCCIERHVSKERRLIIDVRTLKNAPRCICGAFAHGTFRFWMNWILPMEQKCRQVLYQIDIIGRNHDHIVFVVIRFGDLELRQAVSGISRRSVIAHRCALVRNASVEGMNLNQHESQQLHDAIKPFAQDLDDQQKSNSSTASRPDCFRLGTKGRL
jgi:hypothetical protein